MGRKKANSSQSRYDQDWKPDFDGIISKPNLDPKPKPRASMSPTAPQTFAYLSSENIYQGVLTIVELIPLMPEFPARFVVITDKDKELLRFPFGQLEESDSSESEGAERETSEEVGITAKFQENNRVDSINFGNCLFHIFHIKVPASTPIILGPEQESWTVPTADEIDSWISQGLVSPKHAKSWEIFKQKKLNPQSK